MSAIGKVALIGVGLAGFVSAIGWFSYQSMRGTSNSTPTGMSTDQEATLRARGAYLMAICGCNDCHSPHDQTGKLIAGLEFTGHHAEMPAAEWDPSMLQKGVLFAISPTGTSIAGPHGVSYAANLTPDKETGLGNLTADGLIRSRRTGMHWKEPRQILPLMPFESFANMTDDDIRAVHAFLMSLPAMRNRVPSVQISK